jgi:hypothetical protein
MAPEPAGFAVNDQVYDVSGFPKAPELFSDARDTCEPGTAAAGAVIEATEFLTAASAFTFPYPHVVLGGGVEPSVAGFAVRLIRSRICAPVRAGLDCHASAAIPVTCGVAMLVPAMMT